MSERRRRSRLSESLSPYLPDGPAGGVTKLSISLPTELVEQVRATAEERGTSVSATIAAALRLALVRSAPSTTASDEPVDPATADWLVANDVRLRPVRDDEWRRRLEAFLEDRRALAARSAWTAAEVQADVDAAVAEVRGDRAARGR
jgi:hypothetical protein